MLCYGHLRRQRTTVFGRKQVNCRLASLVSGVTHSNNNISASSMARHLLTDMFTLANNFIKYFYIRVIDEEIHNQMD